jgi:hypothetical protein
MSEPLIINGAPHEEIFPKVGDAVPEGCQWILKGPGWDNEWSKFGQSHFKAIHLNASFIPRFARPIAPAAPTPAQPTSEAGKLAGPKIVSLKQAREIALEQLRISEQRQRDYVESEARRDDEPTHPAPVPPSADGADVAATETPRTVEFLVNQIKNQQTTEEEDYTALCDFARQLERELIITDKLREKVRMENWEMRNAKDDLRRRTEDLDAVRWMLDEKDRENAELRATIERLTGERDAATYHSGEQLKALEAYEQQVQRLEAQAATDAATIAGLRDDCMKYQHERDQRDGRIIILRQELAEAGREITKWKEQAREWKHNHGDQLRRKRAVSDLLSAASKGRDKAISKLAEAEAKLGRMREALEFYANNDNWWDYPTAEKWESSGGNYGKYVQGKAGDSSIEKDEGEKARAALNPQAGEGGR